LSNESVVFSQLIDTPLNHSLPTEFSPTSDTKVSPKQKADEMSEMLESTVSKSDLQALERNMKEWIKNKLKKHKEETSKDLSVHELQAIRVEKINSKLIKSKNYIKSIAAEVAEFKQKLKEEIEEIKNWVERKLQNQYNIVMKDKEDLLKDIKELRYQLKLKEQESVIEDKLKEIKASFEQQIDELEKLNVKRMNSLAGSLKKEFNEQHKETNNRILTSEEKCEAFSKSQQSRWDAIRAIYDKNSNIKKTITDKMVQFSTQLEATKNTLIDKLKLSKEKTTEEKLEGSISSSDDISVYGPMTETNQSRKNSIIPVKKDSRSMSLQSEFSELFREPLESQNIEEERDVTQIVKKNVSNVTEAKDSLANSPGKRIDNVFNANKNSKEGLMSNNTISSTSIEQTIVDA